MNPGATPARTTGEWEQPRHSQAGDPWDEPKSKSTRQFQRPTLRPVPDLPEPTVQIDPATFFEPEHPRSRPRPVRQETPQVFQEPQFQPTFIEGEHPALVQASAHPGSGGFGGGEMGGGRMSHQSQMSASNMPPQGPLEPVRGPDPGYPTAPGFTPESFPTPTSEPPAQQAGPQMPASPPPAPFEEPKSGRFGKKGRAKPERAPKPAAAPPPAAPASFMTPAAAQEKRKKEKKGLFKGSSAPKAEIQPAVPPPAVPAKPVTPPKPRFTAPFNYTPPTSPLPPAPPHYPTTPATGPANRSPWAPPASFRPPATPSFGNWGPKPAEPAPEPPAQTGTPTPPGQPFVPPAGPSFGNGNGHSHMGPEDAALESGQWPFDFNSTRVGETSGPHRDPELPAYIELSMFQDPTSADDIAAEQDADSEQPEAEAEEVAETDGAQEAWLADDAWPAPKESRRRWKRDPWPTEDIPPVEEAELLEQHWPQNAHEAEETAVTDWTSPDTPWPGETRRPAEPNWAAEPPAAESQQPAPQWGDEPWQHERPRNEAVAEQQWTHREPSAEHPATDPWGQERERRAAAEQPVLEPWGRDRAPEPVQEAPEPWSQESFRYAPEVPAEDPWAKARVRKVEPVRSRAEQPAPEHRAPAEPEAPSNRRQIFVDDEEDWKPLSIDLNLDEDRPAPDPVLEAAVRLKAAETAIKVANGLAYVLVDDEGRPVLR